MDKEYHPIKCDYYDRLEEWATRKQALTIKYLSEDEQEQQAEGVVIDLYVREHVEYLELNNGTEIRLDRIKSINDEMMTYKL
jgi:Rho-binding antiterminator